MTTCMDVTRAQLRSAAEAVASVHTRCPDWEAAAGPGLGCGQGPGHRQLRDCSAGVMCHNLHTSLPRLTHCR